MQRKQSREETIPSRLCSHACHTRIQSQGHLDSAWPSSARSTPPSPASAASSPPASPTSLASSADRAEVLVDVRPRDRPQRGPRGRGGGHRASRGRVGFLPADGPRRASGVDGRGGGFHESGDGEGSDKARLYSCEPARAVKSTD